jgi:antitoxin ParD1/3/4
MNANRDPSEIVREALRVLQEREDLKKHRLDELRKEIALGIQQADQREFVDGPEAFRQIRRSAIRRIQ